MKKNIAHKLLKPGAINALRFNYKTAAHISFLKAICFILLITETFQVKGQDFQTSYFGHGGYTAKFDDNPNTKNQSAFNSGGLDILLTSEISEKFTALGELFTGYRGDGANSVTLSVERLYFKYAANDYINFRIGRMYTPLGFWQSRYSQAQFFQPTINAPYAVRTKFDKGILPTNSVGFQIDGENIGKLRFSYYLMLDNTVGAPSLNTDNNDFKSITAKLKFEPIKNTEVYVSGRYDQIERGSQSIQGHVLTGNTDQRILNAGIVHIDQSSNFEFACEYFNVNNKLNMDTTSQITSNNFAYAYLGYRIKKVTPYVQWDMLRFDTKDQYFITNDLDGIVAGIRYSPYPKVVIKAEYKYRHNKEINHQDVLSLQVAARF